MGVDAKKAVRRLHERLSHRSIADSEAESEAKALLPMLVAALKEAGAKQVLLFGSLADGSFRRGSDIDLAVDGLSERALAKLESKFALVTGIPVELANLDVISASVRERIHRVGVALT